MEKKKELAILINSKAEFEAVKEYLKEVLKLQAMDDSDSVDFYKKSITYLRIDSHGYHWQSDMWRYDIMNNHQIISFANFAKLTGIELPKEELRVALATNESCTVNKHGVDFDEPIGSLSGFSIRAIHAAFTSLTPPRQ